MTTFTVLQEQSMLLYVIAGLLIVLIVVGIGVWLRLGEVRLSGRQGFEQARTEGSDVEGPPGAGAPVRFLRREGVR